jgi:hypothetical protein
MPVKETKDTGNVGKNRASSQMLSEKQALAKAFSGLISFL